MQMWYNGNEIKGPKRRRTEFCADVRKFLKLFLSDTVSGGTIRFLDVMKNLKTSKNRHMNFLESRKSELSFWTEVGIPVDEEAFVGTTIDDDTTTE